MKKAVFAPALAALALTAVLATPAAAQVYQYKDAQGNTIFSDRPPPGAQAREVAPASATQRRAPAAAPAVESAAEGLAADAAAPTAEQSAADRALAERQARDEAAKEHEEAAAAAAREQEREQLCLSLDADIAGLESGMRVTRINTTTKEREFLSDVERAAELSRKKEQFQKNCVATDS